MQRSEDSAAGMVCTAARRTEAPSSLAARRHGRSLFSFASLASWSPPPIRSSALFLMSVLLLGPLSSVSAAALVASPPSSSLSPPSPLHATPIVICPGFGNDVTDYIEPLSQPRSAGLVSALERRGFDPSLVSIVPVKRADWIRVGGGLLDVNFYRGTARPTGAAYGWYIDRLRETVDEVHERSGGERVILLGHSAGGWLARAAMGDGSWSSGDGGGIRTAEKVRCLATLGAIHRAPIDSWKCVTRGALAYTDSEYPGAYLAGEGVAYVSVGGDAIVGDDSDGAARAREKERDSVGVVSGGADVVVGGSEEADRLYSVRGEGSAARVAYTSYEAVCGRGDVTGDGVVPLEWSMLDGARQIRLEGVLHSINEAGTTIPTDRWYGSGKVIDRWLPAVLEEAGLVTSQTSAAASGAGRLEAMRRWAAEVLKF